jgi:peptidoglycan L-alanyl-D-glutamate endopeptidase CwlK
MFPGAPLANIQANLPHVLQALADAQLGDKKMLLMALGTIRAETAGFEPIAEGVSRYNTSPGGHPFDLYDKRPDLGNAGAPDGERFRGRGFVQLTGRANYTQHGAAIGVDLVADPDKANEPVIAARLLAAFLKARESRIRAALAAFDLGTARRLVNGGHNGLDGFASAYRTGDLLI